MNRIARIHSDIRDLLTVSVLKAENFGVAKEIFGVAGSSFFAEKVKIQG
ncbi:hypothetical protein NC796_17865 [Aliifodinibius sp. S!AR15-10]|nr:hypothetical protein [Aliifodinibius sp. S!AR15-10]MDR8393028.1 hypothetical protein [Aliifodinibius sp. S!AR15-10]